ncbi:MAG TPA: glycosyltransferase WbuB [Chloroflexi bacterium]|nr:glycosyltransferase WbuB [Chloroflexota bacterium]
MAGAKVVHFTVVHRPFDTRIFQKECRTLVREGYRVALVAPHTRREVVDGVEIVPLPRFPNRLVRMGWGAWVAGWIVHRLRGDLYHFHDPELLPVGLLLKRSTSAPVIYDVHEDYPRLFAAKEWLPRSLRGGAARLVERLEKRACRRLDGFVAATETIARRFPPDKTRVVRNYPSLSVTQWVSEDRRRYEGNYTLIYTGGWTVYRGVYQIVQALGYVTVPQARLVLLGSMSSPRLAEAARELPGYERVEYLGKVPYREMYRYLNEAAVGLVCNQPVHGYQFALPNKLFEYMAAGLPVIASNFDLWREIVEGNECGVTVDPTSPRRIAEAIDDLLNRPDARRVMGRNARQAIRDKYNWEQESRKLVGLYEEVLSR